MKLNARAWYKRKTLLTIILISIVLTCSLIAGRWFQSTYVGWLVEAVEAPLALQAQWQQALDNKPNLKHPMVLHLLPSECVCTLLTLKHAKTVSEKAVNAGYTVTQIESDHPGLGSTLELDVPKLSPFIAMTNAEGVIQYLGAYSDGIRCTEANSLVDAFAESLDNLPKTPVIGLNVQVCRCLINQ